MIKKIISVLFTAVLFCTFYACESRTDVDGTTSETEIQTTLPETTEPTVSTTRQRTAATTVIQRISETQPEVQMPDDDTTWANYIVDSDYNYIADRLTSEQKSNAVKAASSVKCRVEFGEESTSVTDSTGNTVVYSKIFPEGLDIDEPFFGVLTLVTETQGETVLIYKGATIQYFSSYTKMVRENAYKYFSRTSSNYVESTGIFIGENERDDSIIIKLQEGMLIISITYADGENDE